MLNEIDALKSDKLYRSLNVSKGIDFSSNDYLGLSKSDFIKNELLHFIENEQYLWRSSSRLISGTTDLHLKVETDLAKFLNREASLLFNSGYSANLAVISSLCKNSIIFSDEKNHASIIDGIKLSKSECFIYKHNDMDALEDLLIEQSHSKLFKVIVTESLFSMDGDTSDLPRLIQLANEHKAFLILDEAHATGIYGDNGAGLLSKCNLRNTNNIVSIHTGGKALGSPGAFIGCSKQIKELIINKARHFIYTTGTHPLNAFMLNESVQHITNNSPLRNKLLKNIKYVQDHLSIERSHPTPIIPILIPGNKQALETANKLISLGLSVKAIRYPTVAKGSERIRLSIHADHTFNELDLLCNSLKDVKAV